MKKKIEHRGEQMIGLPLSEYPMPMVVRFGKVPNSRPTEMEASELTTI